MDAIVTPVSPFPAFKLGEKMADPLEMYLSDIYTITGQPGGNPVHERALRQDLRGPAGRACRFLTSHFEEGKLLKIADAFEKAGGFER